MIATIETALVVDDDALMREFIVETLKRNKINIVETNNGLDAKRLLEDRPFDMAFIDLKMPGLDGMQLLKHMKTRELDTLPVIITAFGTVEKAVEAMQNGAYDFLMKPFSPEQVEIIINRARDFVSLQAQNSYLKEELGWVLPHGRQMVGQTPSIAKLMKDVKQVASSSSTVLITGESGTGKELVALAIHALSDRRAQPFIRMNCAAVPDALMDSELFGHEKGSFTSAVSRRIGRFELAHNGTLLLDEISEMNVGVQAKLLRVLQEHEFERVGGSHTIRTDCRLIATTNRSLKECVEKGTFRQELFYRLNVVPIHAPPLRERCEDIPILVNTFIQRFSQVRGKSAPAIVVHADAMDALLNYSWPGNVRELENLVERLCVMRQGEEIGPSDLPAELVNSAPRSVPAAGVAEDQMYSIPDIEHKTIIRALRATGGNRRRSAELLGISIRTLRNKLNQYRADSKLPGDL
ncbi:MAG: sigma-54 dependent transcriptional regulator [Lentisphaerota bacterium]